MDYTRELAVALGYDPDKFDAPFVIAKGKGEIARKIMEEAKRHNVPIVRSPDLVRKLYELEVLEQIPEELFVAVAEILIFVRNL